MERVIPVDQLKDEPKTSGWSACRTPVADTSRFVDVFSLPETNSALLPQPSAAKADADSPFRKK